jgi:hypothetical protein
MSPFTWLLLAVFALLVLAYVRKRREAAPAVQRAAAKRERRSTPSMRRGMCTSTRRK